MFKEKTQAVSQQLSVLTAQIGNNVATYLVPNYNDGQKLAIIDEGVLEYLKDLLPKANPYEIITNFMGKLDGIRNHPCTLDAAVKECMDFVAFHQGVNLMKKYFDPKTKVEYQEPFNKEAKPLTLQEMIVQNGALVTEVQKLTDIISKHPDWIGNVDDIGSKTASFTVEVLVPMKKRNEEPTIVSERAH